MIDIERRDDIALLWMDQPGEPVNTLSPAVLAAFEEALDAAAADPAVRGIVLISRKPDSFIVGADLRVLQGVQGPGEAEALSREGHRLLRRVRALDKPIVAALHGSALGGGLEVALACTYRLATNHRATKLALPEVRLGLLPGGGGTQLLPRLVGLQRALGLMLTGKNIYPRQARRMGLVDALIHAPGLADAAVRAARRLADGSLVPDRDHAALKDRLLESNPLTRRLIYQQAEARVRRETQGHYPAPFRIIEAVRTGMEKGLDAGLDAEARFFGELAFTPVARQLIFLFFAQQAARKNPWKERARPIRTVGVLGAGLMGAGIAEITALAGMEVLLKDKDLEHAAQGRRRIWQHLERQARKGALSAFERDRTLERVAPVEGYGPFAGVDLVIEAAPENTALKQRLLADIEEAAPADVIFASNTSSIPLATLAAEAARPAAVVGMHYFSPVPKVPLLEIIRTAQTTDDVLGTAFELGVRQGKTVIVVHDGPGFYTTRVLAAYLNEALRLLREGARIEQVDRAMRRFGFPMGPFALIDLVGVDVAAKITDVLADFFGPRGLTADPAAADLTAAGLLGQKAGQGFYRYEADRPEKSVGVNEAVYKLLGGGPRRDVAEASIQDRLALLFVNEAVRCLDDGILTAPRDGDVGAVFGLGFPPFRGGPFRYVDAETAPAVFARLERLALVHGPAYQAALRLRAHARTGERFYPSD